MNKLKFKRTQITRFLIFISLFLTIVSAYYLINRRINLFEKDVYLKNDKTIVVANTILESYFNGFTDEVKMLSELMELEVIHLHSNDVTEEMKEVGKVFLKSNSLTYQLRLIDIEGKEIMRLEKKGDKLIDIPKNQLQDKSERYYFKESMKMDKTETYFSEIDLNIENEVIELPHRPTVRIAHKVFGNNGELMGIVVINYDIRLLFELINQFVETEDYTIQILNFGGYWLSHEDSEREWGFMYDNKQNVNLKVINNNLWNLINENNQGNIETKDAWVTFDHYNLSDDVEITMLVFVKNSVFWSEARKIIWLYGIGHVLFFTLITILIVMSERFYMNRLIAKERLQKQAMFDTLTNVPNRLSFNRDLTHKIDHYKNEPKMFSVFFMDLDGFKSVNDQYGHEIGDRVLIDVAHRLKRVIRDTDEVFRLGGDEFTLIVDDLKEKKDVEKIAEKIISTISHRYVYEDIECNIGVSIGISVYPLDSETDNGLINLADDHMYEVKRKGKNNYYYVKE